MDEETNSASSLIEGMTSDMQLAPGNFEHWNDEEMDNVRHRSTRDDRIVDKGILMNVEVSPNNSILVFA